MKEIIPSKKLSIVVPVFNEEKIVSKLASEFQKLLKELEGQGVTRKDLEILFVNDGSSDQTFQFLLQHLEEPFSVLNLSRNYGHQFAITAGIDHSVGEAVVIIDGDLQDPPLFITDLYKKYEEGFDVVYAIRRKRSGETWFKKMTASFFYRFLKKVTHVNAPVDTGDFRIMSRRVANVLSSMRESHRYIRGLTSWIGFKQIGIEYDREARSQGTTKFTLIKMLRFAFDAITSFSGIPLRLMSVVGFISAVLGFVAIGYVLYLKLFTNFTVQGWSSLIGVVLLMGGIQLAALGLIGEYIFRISEQVKNRPLYIVEGHYSKKV